MWNRWIYYCNESDGYSIYKAKTDGTEKIKLLNDEAYNLAYTMVPILLQ